MLRSLNTSVAIVVLCAVMVAGIASGAEEKTAIYRGSSRAVWS